MMSSSARNIFLLVATFFALLASLASADRAVVELWTVQDVARWVNYTIGYPEYSQYFVTHLVDGPTLLHSEVEDFEDTMPITNRIHIAKLKAHLAIVKDKCLCKQESSSLDFWSHARLHQVRTWVLGSAAIFAPRAALIGAYFFDSELYESMTSTTVEESYFDPADGPSQQKRNGRTGTQTSWLFTLVYWILGMLFPSAFMLLNFIPYITTNFLVVPILSINFIVEQHREVFLIMSFLYGDMKSRSAKEIFLALVPIPTAFPLVALLVSFVAPFPLLQLAVVAVMIFSLFIGVGFVMMLFSHEEGAGDEREAAAKRAEAEQEKANSADQSTKGPNHEKLD